jgi:myo-inositol-1(or 4)-monophosphatase
MHDMHDMQDDLDLAARAARRAGELVMGYFRTEMQVRHKGPDQPLTEADLEADALLRDELGGARPGYGWLSEETADNPDRLARSRVWIVDPIDGTRSFIAGRPEFAVSIGLVEDGAVIAGVVYNPARDELYRAIRGGGAFLQHGEGPPARLRVRNGSGPHSVLASRSEIRAGEFDGLGDGWTVQPLGSTAYKLARVAAGAAEACLSRGPKSEWDVCAGVLILEEAGGRVTDVAGRQRAFNLPDANLHGIVGTNGAVHDDLLRRAAALPPLRRHERLDEHGEMEGR